MTFFDRFSNPMICLAASAVFSILVSCATGSSPRAADPAPESGSSPEAAAEAGPVDEPPETYTNTLRWATASEVDNFGFDIYRGESEDGPFERINSEPIPGAGTSDEASKYEYVDDTIDPRKTYFYYVESISLSNVRERFTPIYTAKPKIPE